MSHLKFSPKAPKVVKPALEKPLSLLSIYQPMKSPPLLLIYHH